MSIPGRWGRRLGRPGVFDADPAKGTAIHRFVDPRTKSEVRFNLDVLADSPKGALLTFGVINQKKGVDRTVDMIPMDWPALQRLQYDLRKLLAARREHLKSVK